jgi:uncharacterized membrane protein YccC
MPHAGQSKTRVDATHHKLALSRVTDIALDNRPPSRFGDYAAKTLSASLYGMRLATAVSLALLTAFYLQLDSPSWVGTSAAIVCQPIVGSSLLKGVFRMIGTVVGAVAAVLLTAVFPQDRAGFLFVMLVWASLCSFVSTLLRNFAAYAAMLAGWTLVIIASTSIPAPEQVFEIAVSRASEICIGIVCATLVIALTDLGSSPRRLSELLSRLIAETARHLADVLATGGTQAAQGQEVRRALIARTAALDPIIDQAAGEAPELLQRRSVLHAAMNGLFAALSGTRIVETHLRSLSDGDAHRTASIVLDCLSPDWVSVQQDGAALPQTVLSRYGDLRIVRNLVGLKTNDLSVRLTADGAADVASGLAAAANGLALLDDPANAVDPPRSPSLFVADYLPALVNALRVFLGVGAIVLFWIVTEWSSGLQAVVFAAVTIMLFSPMQERSGKAAFGLGIGTAIAAIAAVAIKFAFLPNHEGFLAFYLIIGAALAPLGALSSVPLLAPYVTPAALNFVPLLAPTNEMTYDAAAFFNSALGLLSGCAVGGLALVLIPPVSTQIRSQRLVDLSIRDLRRLAAGRRWTLPQWQSRIYGRLIALPEEAEPVQRSYLVSVSSVGLHVISLQRLSRHGRIGAEISDIQANLAAGDLAKLRVVLHALDQDIAAIPDTRPGARGRLRARSALLAIGEAVNRQHEYFESHPA